MIAADEVAAIFREESGRAIASSRASFAASISPRSPYRTPSGLTCALRRCASPGWSPS